MNIREDTYVSAGKGLMALVDVNTCLFKSFLARVELVASPGVRFLRACVE